MIPLRWFQLAIQVGRVSLYQVLVVNFPPAYQKIGTFERPIGRMAPRSLRLTERARVPLSAARIQSSSAVPRKRWGEAPVPLAPISCTEVSGTPTSLNTMLVWAGSRPERMVE